jgi:hypothetical protein
MQIQFNKEQIKKISDTFTFVAYGQFGIFGYDTFKNGVWFSFVLSVIAFVLLQIVAVWLLKFPMEDL